jgi:hypothetical protein
LGIKIFRKLACEPQISGARIVLKMPFPHNAYLEFFQPKNTISCGVICLATKPIVFLGFPPECGFLPKFRPCFAAAEP